MPQDLPQKISKPKPSEAEMKERNALLRKVMLGLAIWGLVLGLGAATFGVRPDGGIGINFRPVRGMVVWACVGAFLAVWSGLLRMQKR